MKLFAMTLLITATASVAQAGFVEIGGSFSYKKATIDEGAYEQSQSLTGSVTYYFDESSAIELSYTDGYNKMGFNENLPGGHVTSMFYSLIGLDFIYTFGTHEATFRPYLKAGANYILQKRIVDQFRGTDGTWDPADIHDEVPSLVPDVGAGFKIALTQNISVKIGIDAWSSGPVSQKPFSLDYAGRVGLSFLF